MSIFNFGVSTEQEDLKQQLKEEVWVLDENGELVKMEDIENENN